MAVFKVVIIMVVFMLISCTDSADPDSLQDFCVADLTSGIKVNGYPCKPNVATEDFFSDSLMKLNAINHTEADDGLTATVLTLPSLNTLGISLARLNYAPDGGLYAPPLVHPRATEILFVLEGELDVGFITTDNVHYSKTIKKGDIFVFPKGLLHYAENNSDEPASTISAFSSQLPGFYSPATALFTAKPPVPSSVLANTFRITAHEVEHIRSKFASN